MKDYFGRQDEARNASRRLVVLFGLALLAISLGFYVCLVVAQPFLESSGGPTIHRGGLDWWQPGMLFWTLVFVSGSVGTAAWLKLRALAGGGAAVAESLGARLVDPASIDLKERQLLNVVEEMAIASGVPVPQVFVMDDEPAINAFAAGYAPADAAVAVTRGTLMLLDRDELQGVVAHEFSHILNGDMRLNIRMIAIIYGLSLLGSTGAWLFRAGADAQLLSGSRRRRGGLPAQIAIVGGVLAALGYIGVVCGRLIQSAISRQREFLADAAAVQFTRNPEGLAGALKKIGGYTHGTEIKHHRIEEMSHLFFGDALTHRLTSFLATHPPLPERILRLDPSFGGSFTPFDAPDGFWEPTPPPDPVRNRRYQPAVTGLAALDGVGGQSVAAAVAAAPDSAVAAAPAQAAPSQPPPVGTPRSTPSRKGAWLTSATDHASIAPDEIVEQVGQVSPAHIRWSAELLRSIPAPLREATRSPYDAMALCHAMVLDEREEPQRLQLDALARLAPAELLERVRALKEQTLDRRARLPLLEMALPSLRRLSPDQYQQFLKELNASIEADGHISLFEFAMARSLENTLNRTLRGFAPQPVQYMAVAPLREPLTILLSGICIAGAENPMEALTAFRAGCERVPLLRRADIDIVGPGACTVEAMGKALDMLAASTHGIRRLALDACAHAVLADDDVTLAEAELLRVVADSLECPLPPFLPARVRGG